MKRKIQPGAFEHGVYRLRVVFEKDLKTIYVGLFSSLNRAASERERLLTHHPNKDTINSVHSEYTPQEK